MRRVQVSPSGMVGSYGGGRNVVVVALPVGYHRCPESVIMCASVAMKASQVVAP